MAYNALIHMVLQCDELRFQLVTLVAHTSAVMSLTGNSSRFNVLIYSLLYTVVTSDEFFIKIKLILMLCCMTYHEESTFISDTPCFGQPKSVNSQHSLLLPFSFFRKTYFCTLKGHVSACKSIPFAS